MIFVHRYFRGIIPKMLRFNNLIVEPSIIHTFRLPIYSFTKFSLRIALNSPVSRPSIILSDIQCERTAFVLNLRNNETFKNIGIYLFAIK